MLIDSCLHETSIFVPLELIYGIIHECSVKHIQGNKKIEVGCVQACYF